jgi:Tfp pilus assembly protein PilO
LPIEVRGKGTYAQFHGFLGRLESLRRLSSVGKLTIDADADMSGNVEVQLTLFIYSAKPS